MAGDEGVGRAPAEAIAQEVFHVLLGEGLGARGSRHGQDGQRGAQVAVRPAVGEV